MTDSDNLVWSATVDDNTWLATVTSVEPYKGTLTVSSVSNGTVILIKEVGLSYNAMFGPDVDDVATWQMHTIDAIDTWDG